MKKSVIGKKDMKERLNEERERKKDGKPYKRVKQRKKKLKGGTEEEECTEIVQGQT